MLRSESTSNISCPKFRMNPKKFDCLLNISCPKWLNFKCQNLAFYAKDRIIKCRFKWKWTIFLLKAIAEEIFERPFKGILSKVVNYSKSWMKTFLSMNIQNFSMVFICFLLYKVVVFWVFSFPMRNFLELNSRFYFLTFGRKVENSLCVYDILLRWIFMRKTLCFHSRNFSEWSQFFWTLNFECTLKMNIERKESFFINAENKWWFSSWFRL